MINFHFCCGLLSDNFQESKRNWLYPPFTRVNIDRGEPRFNDIDTEFNVYGYDYSRGVKLRFKCDQIKDVKIRTLEVVQKCRKEKLVGFYTIFVAQYNHIKSLNKQCKTILKQLKKGDKVDSKQIKQLEEKLSKSLQVYDQNIYEFYLEFGAKKPKYEHSIYNSIQQHHIDGDGWF